MGKYLVQILSIIPFLVSGIEQIHGEEKSGAEKKQIAMDALGLSANVALALDPAQKPVIQAAYQAASSTIDAVKAVYNAAKQAEGDTPAPKPEPLPVVPQQQ